MVLGVRDSQAGQGVCCGLGPVRGQGHGRAFQHVAPGDGTVCALVNYLSE